MKTPFTISTPWKIIIVFANLLLGVLLWFDYFTNYAIVGRYSEFIIPPIIGLLGFISYRYLSRSISSKRSMIINTLSNIPSIIGGLCGVLVFLPPMCLISLVVVDTKGQETLIEQIVSPDGFQVANVYHGYAGIVDSDEIITIRISPRWFPMIEREEYNKIISESNYNNPKNTIQWINNDTIEIGDIKEQVEANKLKLDSPLWLIEILLIIILLWPK